MSRSPDVTPRVLIHTYMLYDRTTIFIAYISPNKIETDRFVEFERHPKCDDKILGENTEYVILMEKTSIPII